MCLRIMIVRVKECDGNNRTEGMIKKVLFMEAADMVLLRIIYKEFEQWEDMITQQNVLKKSAYAVSGVNETVSIPQLSWGNNRCKWR